MDVASPFTPWMPVPVEFFVGRIPEIERLRGIIRDSKQRRIKVGFVTGERGIGKSSLVSFVRHLTEREDDVLGCHVLLGEIRDLPDMTVKTFEHLLRDNEQKSWYGSMLKIFGDHVKKIGLFGITLELDLTQDERIDLTRNFVSHLRNILLKVPERKTILLILDDINGLASSIDFANWLKSIVDEIAVSRQSMSLCIIIVGLEERRQQLLDLQPSLARIFDLVEIKPWSDDETMEFFKKSYTSVSAEIEEDGLMEMVSFTEGFPVLAHEIGDAVWRQASSLKISRGEVRRGIMVAAEIVGRKSLQPHVFQELHSPRYRSILLKIAQPPAKYSQFTRAELQKRLDDDEIKVMDNFLRKMKELGVILSDPEVGKGAYRFTIKLHKLYFSMEAMKMEKKK